MAIKCDVVTGPAYWASALVNGDLSGLDVEEIKAMESWLDRIYPAYVVDIARDESGEPMESRFTWHYALHSGTRFAGGDVVDYVTHERE